ncbi:hypothetical protein C3B55_00650 [Candidatus Pseudomonas adelgestsugas]|uniref:Uncharacterized protein n=1 Tax=Candidatus Pseudomonas adelgestsugas TaxID=1302376 RepID=A0ABX5R9Y1_9PSED|nr:hypothetical protein C3B55_00650 [Candidatus Pseudomonas adelgestsugas]
MHNVSNLCILQIAEYYKRVILQEIIDLIKIWTKIPTLGYA